MATTTESHTYQGVEYPNGNDYQGGYISYDQYLIGGYGVGGATVVLFSKWITHYPPNYLMSLGSREVVFDITAAVAAITLAGDIQWAAACPANSTGSTICTCNTGYKPDPTSMSCVPDVTCPVTDLTDVKDLQPNGSDVLPLTLLLENTKGSDLALLPAAAEGLACLKRKTAGVFVSSGTRTVAYQAHLKEIWDTLIKLDALEDPVEIKVCKPLRDKVLAEIGGCSNNSGHCLKFQPAKDSKHTIGKAFDVRMVTIDTLLLNLRPIPPLPPKLPLTPIQQQQADIKLIADFLAKPAACSLNWGGNFGDFVHFAVP